MITEADRIKPMVARLQAEHDLAQSALGAAQYERSNYAGDDPHTAATLDLRVSHAQATRDAAATALAEAQADLAVAEPR